MTNHFSELHLLLSRTSQEFRRGLHEIIGAPPGDSPSLLCGHLFSLRASAAGEALDRSDYKQLVTDIADKVGFDWTSIVGPTPWSELSSEQIEAAIVRHVDADKMYREEAPSQPPDVIAALDNAFSSLSGDWRKLLAAVIYIHQVIRPSAKTVETRIVPEAVPPPPSENHSSGNGAGAIAKDLGSLPPSRKSGHEPLRSGSGNLGPTLLDFWRWSASDLASNPTRQALALYIVSCALNLEDDIRGGRQATGQLDCGGLKVEVTSASSRRSDLDEELADVRFPIRGNPAGEAGAGILAVNLKKRADLFVFCLLAGDDEEALDPLDLSQWEFYVVPSSVLDAQFPLGKSIRLESVQELGISAVGYEHLAASIKGSAPPATGRSPVPGWNASLRG